ncbi:hypothetical protein [Okeania sp. SIO3I5]|uniref:hypothetical protein n=1 Tax=Okeania sp. SIO3I5 TaxID=2607805 RepID=UPI0025E00369|nr:hypothetical protein [Okeania sp. SIO3I5]
MVEVQLNYGFIHLMNQKIHGKLLGMFVCLKIKVENLCFQGEKTKKLFLTNPFIKKKR